MRGLAVMVMLFLMLAVALCRPEPVEAAGPDLRVGPEHYCRHESCRVAAKR